MPTRIGIGVIDQLFRSPTKGGRPENFRDGRLTGQQFDQLITKQSTLKPSTSWSA